MRILGQNLKIGGGAMQKNALKETEIHRIWRKYRYADSYLTCKDGPDVQVNQKVDIDLL